MFVAGISSLLFFTGPTSETMPRLVDGPLLDYYSRAVNAARSEPQKALAMLELLLVPENTEVVADYSGIPQSERAAFQRGVERGFSMWKQALGNDFPFRLVAQASSDKAAPLKFVDVMPDSAPDHKGEIRTTRKIQWNRSVHYGEFIATISITKFGIGKSLMAERDVAHVTAHELGHGLGLADAEDLQHIMGPVELGNAYARLSDDEAEAVRAFRKTIRGQIARIPATN